MTEVSDYRYRTVVAVSNLRWNNAEHTMLTCDVLFQELEDMGPIPFTTMPNADTLHGVEVWEKANAGEYGSITEYVPPTVEQLRSRMKSLTPRQIRLALLSVDITEAEVEAALASDPEGLVEWKYSTTYKRTHGLIDSLGAGFSLTPEQIDDLWVWASGV